MKKMLLTSNGLSTPEIKEAFHEMNGNDIKNVRVLFIPTASRTEEELVYVRKTYEELLTAGIMPEHITDFDSQLAPEREFMCIRDSTALQVKGNIRATV